MENRRINVYMHRHLPSCFSTTTRNTCSSAGVHIFYSRRAVGALACSYRLLVGRPAPLRTPSRGLDRTDSSLLGPSHSFLHSTTRLTFLNVLTCSLRRPRPRCARPPSSRRPHRSCWWHCFSTSHSMYADSIGVCTATQPRSPRATRRWRRCAVSRPAAAQAPAGDGAPCLGPALDTCLDAAVIDLDRLTLHAATASPSLDLSMPAVNWRDFMVRIRHRCSPLLIDSSSYFVVSRSSLPCSPLIPRIDTRFSMLSFARCVSLLSVLIQVS